ncbi:hypothetical protein PCK1_002408 [Pneumocystis canis]|nr:hypothetical protein PCK1_002408 [Pneumocystis canis]
MNRLEEKCEFSIFWVTSGLMTREEQMNYLNHIRNLLINEWKRYSEDHLWYDVQGIHFFLNDLPPFLKGQLWYGPSIDDEWILVFILYQFSLLHSDLFIRIIDSDGEFLLIEGATQLPHWLDVHNSAFRVISSLSSFFSPSHSYQKVWFNHGRILLIPPNPNINTKHTKNMEQKEENVSLLTLNDALFFLRNTPQFLIHHQRLEKQIFHRLRGYPEKIKDYQHRTRIIVPRTVAHLLHTSPGLIAAATHEFCQRDPISLKACEKMTTFFPKDMVSVVVRTTKVLHAQLKGQLFQKHPLFNLPDPESLNYEEAILGMKITCGLEMLCSKPLKNNHAYTLKTDPNWIAFLEKLKLAGRICEIHYCDIQETAQVETPRIQLDQTKYLSGINHPMILKYLGKPLKSSPYFHLSLFSQMNNISKKVYDDISSRSKLFCSYIPGLLYCLQAAWFELLPSSMDLPSSIVFQTCILIISILSHINFVLTTEVDSSSLKENLKTMHNFILRIEFTMKELKHYNESSNLRKYWIKTGLYKE